MANNGWNPWNWFQDEEGNRARAPSRNALATQGQGRNPALSPFGPVSRFYQDIDRMFDNAFRNFGLPFLSDNTRPFSSLQDMMFRPNVDVSSTDREYKITAEVPGLDEKDVRIDVSGDGVLTIRGEKKQESEENDQDFHRVERSYGSFQRTLSLPEDADRDTIKADFRNGLLTITIERKEAPQSRTRQIEINSRNANTSGDRAAGNNNSRKAA